MMQPTSAAPRMETYHYSASSIPATEDQLFELVRLSDIPMSKQLFDVIVELLRLNIPPSAILHVLKTLRAQATQTTLPPSLHASRASSRAQTPPTSAATATHVISTRSHGEGNRPAVHRKSERSSASKHQTAMQQPMAEVDKGSSRSKHRHGSSSNKPDLSAHKTSSRTSEKVRSSARGSGRDGSGDKARGQAQDSSS